jgi:hypothetical protein
MDLARVSLPAAAHQEPAMPQSSVPDIVIRSRACLDRAEFVVLCGDTTRVLGGPFQGMSDALGFAVAQAAAARTRVVYETHDERGRSVGERLVLRVAP